MASATTARAFFSRVRALGPAARAWMQTHRRVGIASGAALVLASLAGIAIERGRMVEVRVVNTTTGPLLVGLAGTQGVKVPPALVETPLAGVSLHLSPGRVHLVARDDRAGLVDEIERTLEPGGLYLYAPAVTDQCFFVEHTAYGQARPEAPPRRALVREERIWALPLPIDAWFVPSPPTSESDDRSSGGTRTAVRQARCGFEPWQ
jgi:hypothetical protein